MNLLPQIAISAAFLSLLLPASGVLNSPTAVLAASKSLKQSVRALVAHR